MTSKERILNREEFTFPESYWAYQWPNRISKWYYVNIDGDNNMRLMECESLLGESYAIEKITQKYIFIYSYVFKRKIKIKVTINEVIFKADHLAEYPECK